MSFFIQLNLHKSYFEVLGFVAVHELYLCFLTFLKNSLKASRERSLAENNICISNKNSIIRD